jgi:hypothetical protein
MSPSQIPLSRVQDGLDVPRQKRLDRRKACVEYTA